MSVPYTTPMSRDNYIWVGGRRVGKSQLAIAINHMNKLRQITKGTSLAVGELTIEVEQIIFNDGHVRHHLLDGSTTHPDHELSIPRGSVALYGPIVAAPVPTGQAMINTALTVTLNNYTAANKVLRDMYTLMLREDILGMETLRAKMLAIIDNNEEVFLRAADDT